MNWRHWNGARTVLVCGQIEDTNSHCCEGWEWRAVEVSPPNCATVESEGNRSDRPEVNAELATKHRAAIARVVYLAQIGWIWEWRQLSSPTREGDDERLKRRLSQMVPIS